MSPIKNTRKPNFTFYIELRVASPHFATGTPTNAPGSTLRPLIWLLFDAKSQFHKIRRLLIESMRNDPTKTMDLTMKPETSRIYGTMVRVFSKQVVFGGGGGLAVICRHLRRQSDTILTTFGLLFHPISKFRQIPRLLIEWSWISRSGDKPLAPVQCKHILLGIY